MMGTLHYLDPNPRGGAAVILLHGLGANAESWFLQLPALTEAGFRPLALDLPGFGRSPYDGRGWTLPRVAAQVADWMDTLGLEKAHVVGLSMGGVVAQQLTLDYPQRVGRLVLSNTFAVLRPDSLNGWLYFLSRVLAVSLFGLEKQAELVAHRIFPHPEQKEQYELLVKTISSADPRAYRAAMRALGFYDGRRRLPGLAHPTLVITGADDTTVPPTRQRLLAELIPNARQVVVPQAGHAISVDAPEAYNRLLLDFLSEG